MLRNITSFHNLATQAVERTASGGTEGHKITFNVIKQRLGDVLYKITSQKFEDPADGEEAVKYAHFLPCTLCETPPPPPCPHSFCACPVHSAKLSATAWTVVSACGCDAGPNAKQCMMNSTRNSGLLRRSTDDPLAMQTQCHLLQCIAISSRFDIKSGRASSLYKSRESCGFMRAYISGHLMRHQCRCCKF